MNAKLVESLAQIIQSLTPEERALLEEKIKPYNWQAELQKLQELRDQVFARRADQPFDLPLDEHIHQSRNERIRQQDELISECFTET